MLKLEPTNLELIDTEGKAGIIGRFNGIYNNERLVIWKVKEMVNDKIRFHTFNTYTDVSQFIPVENSRGEYDLPPIVEEFDRYLIVGNNQNNGYIKKTGFRAIFNKMMGDVPKELPAGMLYATSLNVYDLPDKIDVGSCLHPSLGFDVATIKIVRVEPTEMQLNRYERVMEEATNLNKQNNQKLMNILIMRDGLQKQNTFLHTWDAVFTFFAPTLAELRQKVKVFKMNMSRLRVKVDNPRYVQRDLYEKRKPKIDGFTFLSNTTTLDVFYPFSSMELIETGKRAVHLGINKQTGSPVIYNRDSRARGYHVVIVGTIGSGKSMTTKVFMYRLWENITEDSQAVAIIIDPSQTREYRILAERMGIEYKTLEQGIGIDPLHYSAPVATGILAKLFKLDKIQEDNLLRVIEHLQLRNAGIDALEDAVERQTVDIDGHEELLNAVHHGMLKYGYIFKGEFPKKSFAVSTYSIDDNAVVAASTMVMLRTKEYFTELPLATAKFLVVDEGWKLLEDKYSSEILSTISREGRKSNISMIFITQAPKDILENRTGATILNNCDTKILMKTDASREISQLLSLSKIEENLLKTTLERSEPGEALLIADHKHVHMKVTVTPEEMAAFTTKAVA